MKRAPGWVIAAIIPLLAPEHARAENYVVQGEMESRVRLETESRITKVRGVSRLTMSFVVPSSFDSPTCHQAVQDFDLRFSPEPGDRTRQTSARGQELVVATWDSPPDTIRVQAAFTTQSGIRLGTMAAGASFPLTGVPEELRGYLRATSQVEADDPRIRALARELTRDVTTEFDAVQRVLSWVVDHVHYVTPPARYNALYSLDSGKGNCQNFSHLAAALLRSLGIPVRIVNGITLDRPYDLKRDDGVLTFKMGQGRHSWIEVWFPDLAWVPFDPQQTAMFVSNRYVRVEIGVDNDETINDGLIRWTRKEGSAGEVTLEETMAADITEDRIDLRGARQNYGPRNLLLVPAITSTFQKIPFTPPPPPPTIRADERKKLRYTIPFTSGNLEFPEGLDFALPPPRDATGGQGSGMRTRNFYVETAEYVTTGLTQYAQAFVLAKPVRLAKVALALHKFGGDGQLWIELFDDSNGRPGERLATSDMVDLNQMSPRPGYRWQDFPFADDVILMPGQYWIGLGFTGSPVVNWFYTYGKPVGPTEGTRYKGVYEAAWSNALSYEFNYRVTGMTAAF